MSGEVRYLPAFFKQGCFMLYMACGLAVFMAAIAYLSGGSAIRSFITFCRYHKLYREGFKRDNKGESVEINRQAYAIGTVVFGLIFVLVFSCMIGLVSTIFAS